MADSALRGDLVGMFRESALVELAPGRRNIMEKAHDIKYQGMVMGGAFSMGWGMGVSKGRFWALSSRDWGTSSVICTVEKPFWRPVFRMSWTEAESEAGRPCSHSGWNR